MMPGLRYLAAFAFLILLAGAAMAAPSTVTRSFSTTTPTQCSNITVFLAISVNATDATAPNDYYAIDEIVPTGWPVLSSNASGDYTSQAGHVKWLLISGAVSTVDQYVIGVPCNATGANSFTGTYGFGANPTATIGGVTSVTVSAGTDTVPPVITISSPANTTYTSTPTLNYTAVDAGTGTNTSSCYYKLDGGAQTALPGCASATLPALALGGHNVTVYAKDLAGNQGNSTVVFTMSAVPANPAASTVTRSFSTAMPAPCTNFTVTLTVFVNSTDSVAPNDYYAIEETFPSAFMAVVLGGGALANHTLRWAVISGATNATYQYGLNVACNSTGIYNFTGTYGFGANAVQNTSGQANVTAADIVPPVVAVQSPANTSYGGSSIPLNFTAVDAGVGVNTSACSYVLDGGASTALAGCANATLSGLTTGGHSVTVSAKDLAGNGANATVVFTMDATPPVTNATAIDNASASYTFGANISSNFVTVTLNCTDIGAGCGAIRYCADTTNTCAPNIVYSSPFQVTASGQSYIRFYSNDTLGNAEAVQNRTIILNYGLVSTNATAVTNTSANYAFGSWTSSPYVIVTLACTSVGSSTCSATSYCLDTANTCVPSANYSAPVNVSAKGQSYIRYRSSDTTGNIEATNSRTVLIDSDAPTIVQTSPASLSATNSSPVAFNFTAYDSSVNMTCSLYIDGTLNQSGQAVNATPVVYSVGLADGTHSWFVSCTDAAALTTNGSTYGFLVDTQQPVVTLNLPADASVFNATNINFNFTATDNINNPISCALRIDGVLAGSASATNNTLTNIPVVGLALGNHTWNVACSDNASTAVSATRSLLVDTDSPNVTAYAPANGTVFGTSSVLFSFRYEDGVHPTVPCYLYLDGALNQTNASVLNATVTNLTINGIPDGSHSWQVQCTDPENATGIGSGQFTVSTTAPAVTLISPANAALTNAAAPFTYQANDTAGKPMSCSLNVDGTTTQTNSSVQSGATSTFPVTGLADGAHSWNVSCTSVGNQTGSSATRTFTLDSIAPAVTLNSPANGTFINSSTLNVSFTPADAVSSTMSCSFFVDGTLRQTNATTLNGTATSESLSGLFDGVHSWSVSCTDQAGNTNASAASAFTVATGAPVVTASSPANGTIFNNSTVAFAFSFTSSLSPTASCSLYVDGAVVQTNANVSASVITGLSATGLADGTHNWNVTCTDLASNVGASIMRTVTTIATAPAVTLAAPASGVTLTTSTVNFTFSYSSGMSATASCSLYLNGALSQTNASTLNNTATTLSVGGFSDSVNTWYVRCTDVAANTAQSSTSNLIVDAGAPTITLVSPANGASIASSTPINVTLNFTATDSTLMSCSLYLDGVLNYSAVGMASGSASVTNTLGLGAHSWSVNCTDANAHASAPSTASFSIVVPAPPGGGGTGGGTGGGAGTGSSGDYSTGLVRAPTPTPKAEAEATPAPSVGPTARPTPTPKATEEIRVTQSVAQKALDDAASEIDSAQANGMDVSDAVLKLNQARDAFNKADYVTATQLADQARSIALTAQPYPVVAGATTDWTPLVAIIILVAGIGGYMLYQRRKRGPKWY